jgi:peptidyl-prolyl cis-trans isomerase-like 1
MAAATSSPPVPEVQVNTSMGTFTVELYTKQAPKTCQNFYELAKRGYYDGVVFHRIIPDFMVQGGDPTGTGRGGESIFGGKFADEITRELKHTGAGILSMANAGQNTNGSQFFITLAPCPHLDGKHTVFGRISSGMSVIQRLGLARTDANDRPIDPVRIVTARPSGAAAGTLATA